MADERRPRWVCGLGIALALIQIANRRWKRIYALLQAAVEALLGFLAIVADEIGGDDRKHICRKPPAARTEINRFMRELEIDASVVELAEHVPVVEIAGAAVNLMDDHAPRFAFLKARQHPGEHRTARLGGGLNFNEPIDDFETALRCKPLDVVPLYIKRNAVLLFSIRNPYVAKIWSHRAGD
ncbi:MAG: hypothetical protein WDM89_12660 [Rhizomicrobium sp.]